MRALQARVADTNEKGRAHSRCASRTRMGQAHVTDTNRKSGSTRTPGARRTQINTITDAIGGSGSGGGGAMRARVRYVPAKRLEGTAENGI